VIERNPNENFITYIKEQLISLYNENTYEKNNIENKVFIKFIKYNNIYVYIDVNFNIKATISVVLESKLLHGGKDVAHIEDFIIDEKYKETKINEELLSFVIDDIKQKNNIYRIMVTCNKKMEEFYKRFNFKNKNNIEMTCNI
jgi:hypothetical protein